MAGTFTLLLYHLIWSTKHRQLWITDDIRERLHAFIGGIIRDEGGTLLVMGSVEDHAHLLVRWRTDESVSYLLRNVKARSSRWVHETFPTLQAFAWQEGYMAFTVSPSKKEDVVGYIRSQREHHRVQGYKEEVIAFLERHGVAYDAEHVLA